MLPVAPVNDGAADSVVQRPGAEHLPAARPALILLERMGLSAADLTAVPRDRAKVPTFAEYVPVVSAAGGSLFRQGSN